MDGEAAAQDDITRGNLAVRHLDNLEVGDYLLAGKLNNLRDSRRRSSADMDFEGGVLDRRGWGKPRRFAESIIDWMARGTAAKRTSISYLVSTTTRLVLIPASW